MRAPSAVRLVNSVHCACSHVPVITTVGTYTQFSALLPGTAVSPYWSHTSIGGRIPIALSVRDGHGWAHTCVAVRLGVFTVADTVDPADMLPPPVVMFVQRQWVGAHLREACQSRSIAVSAGTDGGSFGGRVAVSLGGFTRCIWGFYTTYFTTTDIPLEYKKRWRGGSDQRTYKGEYQ